MVLDYAHVLATGSPTAAGTNSPTVAETSPPTAAETSSHTVVETPMQSVHRHRLLRDVAEMQRKSYPRIRLTPVDHTQACLVLTPEGYPPLHLTVLFGPQYPLQPPRITIQSKIRHPNVFGNYICATILNTAEGYTPAYTLKGICIQMLSFFHSDGVEQDHDGSRVSLSEYRENWYREHERVCRVCREARAAGAAYTCAHCGFGRKDQIAESKDGNSSNAERNEENNDGHKLPLITLEAPGNGTQKRAVLEASISSLPDEILLETLENVDFEDLVAFAQAWPRVRQLLRDYDLIRSRELQCFTTKHGYKQASLGVGIALTPAGLVPRIDSEFDLISWEAYEKLRVRVSVHGIPYSYWLPLPISRGHWLRIRDKAGVALRRLARHVAKPGRGPQVSAAAALFCFMNDIVVRLSLDLERQQGSSGRRRRRRRRSSLSDEDEGGWREQKSTLRHASEKAIESYFHLFHLLVCLATGPGGKDIVAEVNAMIRSFLRGRRSKRDVSNLGHLLTAMHISDVPVTGELRKAIITEAITRNVVWLLDGRGACGRGVPDTESWFLHSSVQLSKVGTSHIIKSDMAKCRYQYERMSMILL